MAEPVKLAEKSRAPVSQQTHTVPPPADTQAIGGLVSLTIDGQETIPLLPRDCVTICRAPNKALIVHTDKRTFYEVLRTKLNWTGEPNA